MAPPDERRRLRVVRPRAEAPAFGTRQRGPGRAIGIADAAPPGAALEWSLELAGELAKDGPITLVACAFGEVPELGGSSRARAAAAGIDLWVRPVEPVSGGLLPLFAELGDARGVWVCVGEPAVALLEPWLSIVLSADLPLGRWLPSLAPHAASTSLGLGLPRAGLTRELAARIRTP
jgi:hypothetical protein